MRNKNKKVLLSFLIIFFLVFLVNFCLAQFGWQPEVRYPTIGTKTITSATDLPNYIIYIFNLAIIVGVIIVVGVIISGGIAYLGSTGDPGKLSGAKDKIFNGFLGLLILLASYLILATVNPQLTVIRLEEIGIKWGVVLIDPPDEQKTIGSDIADIQKTFGPGFEPTEVVFLTEAIGEIKVIAFASSSYQGDSKELLGDGSVNFVIRSIKIMGIKAGVYLWSGPNPTTDESTFMTTDVPRLSTRDFNDKAEYIEIRNKPGTDFAAILHNDSNFRGWCRIFYEKIPISAINVNNILGRVNIYALDPNNDLPFGNVPPDDPTTPNNEAKTSVTHPSGASYDNYGTSKGVSSAHIFQINPQGSCKVTFYKETDFRGDETKKEEVCQINKPILIPSNIEKVGTDEICGNGWDNTIKSIQIEGRCLVVLFEHHDGTGKCEVFKSSDPNLPKDNPIGSCDPTGIWWLTWWPNSPCTSAIAIYPLK
ncbi:MAG: hypothetical protein QMC93_00360 [Patescibacteria group bacterium]|nr:hypothetical protein [Patescibacteria group bacterium]